LTIHVERETDSERIERCDHDGTTEPLNGLSSGLAALFFSRHPWPPARAAAGAPIVQQAAAVVAPSKSHSRPCQPRTQSRECRNWPQRRNHLVLPHDSQGGVESTVTSSGQTPVNGP